MPILPCFSSPRRTGIDPGRLILWETSTPDGLEFEMSDGASTVVMTLRWREIERLQRGITAALGTRPIK